MFQRTRRTSNTSQPKDAGGFMAAPKQLTQEQRDQLLYLTARLTFLMAGRVADIENLKSNQTWTQLQTLLDTINGYK